MGQRSVLFHAFLASLVPIAGAVGVAPSGSSSPDFYRSRRLRTTNSTPLGASVHNSASAGSAVAVLDDLTRKSRVLLAQKRSGSSAEHRLLTWNAGGGAPQPEFLGGPWETEFGAMYSKVEQMTGVLLFEIAGCEVLTMVDGKVATTPDGEVVLGKGFEKYGRYGPLYKRFKETAGVSDTFVKDREGLEFPTLLGSLKTAYDGTSEASVLPAWVDTKTKHGVCTIGEAIRVALSLCPTKDEAKKWKDKYQKKTDNFACGAFSLGTEGCWKKRGALPVYGDRFFQLYGARKGKSQDLSAYWTLFMDGLRKQDEVPEKGCTIKEGDFNEKGRPGEHVGKDVEAEATYAIDGAATKVKGHKHFTFEEWSKTAAWDTLVIDLTELSIKYLNLMGEDLKLEAGDGYKVVPYIDDTQAGETITKIVEGAQKVKQPDVIFLQEAGMIGAGGGSKPGWLSYDRKEAAKDTAIYVRNDFGGGIDDEASDALETAWNEMMRTISTKIDAELNKFIPEGTEKDKLKEAKAKAWPKIDYSNIPELQLPKTDEGPEERTKEDGKTETMEMRIKTQHDNFLAEGAAKDGKGVVYATKLDLVTVAMTQGNPGVLLLSIHADSDGYNCAQYLNLAVKFFNAIRTPVKTRYSVDLTRMYIGMDANVQPPFGHLSWENKKGFTFKQLEAAKPEGMKMVDPKQRTVKKVRSFLQTQFGKIGKDDEMKKDLLFLYSTGEEPIGSKDAAVFNVYKATPGEGEEPLSFSEEEPLYYPKNEWPVDHFMSYATVTGPPAAAKEEHAVVKGVKSVAGKVCQALKRAVRKTTYNVKRCFTKLTKKAGDDKKKASGDDELTTKAREVGEQALGELKKPEKPGADKTE